MGQYLEGGRCLDSNFKHSQIYSNIWREKKQKSAKNIYKLDINKKDYFKYSSAKCP